MEPKLVFAINGERFELAKVHPSTTLLEFLRTQTPFTGAKLGCGEGGCGACVVLLSTYDPVSDQVKEFSVSSCLTLLCGINFCSVTTSEGLGNSKDGFHSIQQRFAGFHASQCGFCTPGMCMSLFAALTNSDKSSRAEPPNGFSKIRKSEAEKAVAGNLCRCTGYRPIADACKSFAVDVDLEDLGLNTFWKKGVEDADINRLPRYGRSAISTFPVFLKSEIKSLLGSLENSKDVSFPECHWYRPSGIEELYKLLNSNEFDESRVKLVVGNTGSGVYKEKDLYDKYIDLKGIPELSIIKRDDSGIVFGAAVPISRTIEELNKGKERMFQSKESLIFAKIAEHMDKVATPFVRNMASLGGNLIMAQRNQFASDVATILLATGSTVCLQMPSKKVTLSLEEFLQGPPCDDRTILLSIHIPCWSSTMESCSEAKQHTISASANESSILFETYRAAPRPLGNAVSYLNSAFLANVSMDKNSGDSVILDLNLAYGAYGGEHAIRAKEVENFLIGKVLTASVLLEATKILRKTIIPKEDIPHSNYRSSLAVGFLFKFLGPLAKELHVPEKNLHADTSGVFKLTGHPNGKIIGNADTLVHREFSNCTLTSSLDDILSSTQSIQFSKDYYPVGEPIKKTGAEIQASGEARYVDDITSPKDCLYGAFVYSTRALAYIKGVQFNSTPSSQKVIAYIGAGDIPKGGQNIGLDILNLTEVLFANSLTECAGQALGIVIAETQKLANMAAKQARVKYNTENLEPPILSVEDAVKRSSLFEIPPFFRPQKVGDFSKGMAEADQKIHAAEVKLSSQYYFYMETQSVLAIPEEDNCILVYSSSQCPEVAQKTIAKCLGIPFHNVRVITRRVGGGFGGKALRSVPVATACALAAFKLRRPVKMYLDRQTDIVMMGGRHPMKINYDVGFKSDGKITALHVDILINAGITNDASPFIPLNTVTALKKYNWGALSFDIKLCKTNVSTKSAMRGPGEVQGSYIAEAIIQDVASFLSKDSHSVKKKNLHTYDSLKLFYPVSAGDVPEYTLPSIVDDLTSSARYSERLEKVQHFNGFNKWRKRGISWVPVIYQVMQMPTPGKVSILDDGSIVIEVGGIELGQGLWTKVNQMAAFSLGQLWDDGSQNLLDKVRVVQADTLSLIQGGITSGSTTSESSCAAVRESCKILADRLKPVKENLEAQMGSVSWDYLIVEATRQSVNLSAHAYWVPERTSSIYLNYGAAMSEVEIDVLTGATTIMRTDLIYDCGQSLNPAVDLGAALILPPANPLNLHFQPPPFRPHCPLAEERASGSVESSCLSEMAVPSTDIFKLGFIGAGNMAESIARGVAKSGVLPPPSIRTAHRRPERRLVFESFGVRILETNCQVVDESDIIVLSVKPQAAKQVLSDLKPFLSDEKLLVSIAAGIKLRDLQEWSGQRRIIRVMPNTPSAVGQAASVMCVGEMATEKDEERVASLFRAIGKVWTADEKYFDAVTGLSGSGPAYIYLAIEALADGGVAAGLPRDLALSLASQTVLGAATMVNQTGKHPGQLKDAVTSPAGTTIAGIHELEKGAYRATLMNAVIAATKRCRELSQS